MEKNKKEELFDELIKDIGKCQKCVFLKKDKSLINFYNDITFAKEIPSIWTDWYNRLNSQIMIIGQDWGPYEEMRRLNLEYNNAKNNENWKKLIDSEKSLTKKQLYKYLIESSNGKLKSLDDIYITNAIMCGRKGNSYRGNNISLKYSTLSCGNFLLRQINIVKPKVILTLGYYPLLAVSKIFNFEIKENLRDSIKERPIIYANDYVIIPLYHPVAQIRKEEQLTQYNRIWEYVDI